MYSHQDYALRCKINDDLKLVFAVVYKEILQLAFVEQFLDMLSKAFIGSVYPSLSRKGEVILSTGVGSGERDIFGPAYQIIYNKWDAVVKTQQNAPKKMKTFAETNKGKKLKKKDKAKKESQGDTLIPDLSQD